MKKVYLTLMTALLSASAMAQVDIPGLANSVGSPVKVLNSGSNLNTYINGAKTIQTTDSSGNSQTVVSPVPGVYIQTPVIPGLTTNANNGTNNTTTNGNTNNVASDSVQSGGPQTIKTGGQNNADALKQVEQDAALAKEKEKAAQEQAQTQVPNANPNATGLVPIAQKKHVGSQVEIEVKNVILPMSSWNTTTIDEFEKQGREKLGQATR